MKRNELILVSLPPVTVSLVYITDDLGGSWRPAVPPAPTSWRPQEPPVTAWREKD